MKLAQILECDFIHKIKMKHAYLRNVLKHGLHINMNLETTNTLTFQNSENKKLWYGLLSESFKT